MTFRIKYLIQLFCIHFLWSCAAKKPYVRESLYENNGTLETASISNIDYELYLVGDIGASNSDVSKSGIVDLIKSELVKTDTEKSVVFLGNTLSNTGFNEIEESSDFKKSDLAVEACIKNLKDHTDKVYFIPGNAEWYDGQNYTTTALENAEEYIQSKVDGKNIFAPSHGCGEPKVVKLTSDLLLVLVDSQWVLQGDRSDERTRSGCEIDTEQELVIFLKEILAKNKNKNVIIAAHHPVYSNGKTGGNYGLKSHLLPLPILGSIFTGAKKIGGGEQKFGNPKYETYRGVMNLVLSNFEGVIHASAHDKNLQYHKEKDNHYVVAGSGSEVDYVRKGGTAEFALMEKGFTKITHTKDLELWLEFYIPDPHNPSISKSVYKKRLYKKVFNNYEDKKIYKDAEDLPRVITTRASDKYVKGRLGIGSTYRKAWSTDVEFPLLLLDDAHGGLVPIKQGGGFQTRSLRLENAKGQQWVIRSVDKDVYKVVPAALRSTIVSDYYQDGVSAAHPYGASVVPPFAEAVGIYHANPKYVWLPAQKALGDYNKDFSEKLYLYEERPGGNMDGHPTYGGATESINTLELVSKLYKNHKHKVDQKYVLKARLLDLLLGDWDRHDDQWRWGIYEEEGINKKIYRAIPRDRDQVFFKNDGFLNYLASRPYITPSIRKFDKEIDFISGLAFNARHFDRHFLSELNEEDFIKTAELIQTAVTDKLINEALRLWPEKIYELDGKEIEAKLKARRADMVKYAKDFYSYLTKEVTAIGTNSQNTFDIKAMPNDMLDVQVYHKDKDGDNHLIWSRIIAGKDCNELRLIGLKKDDTFNFSGSDKSSVNVVIVGGGGDDVINNDASHISIIANDRPKGMTTNGNGIKTNLKDVRGINKFDRKDWKLNTSIHFPMISFYTDEGIGLSYNVLWRKNGFRKNPFKSNHSLNLGYFWANNAIVANYSGHWTSVFGRDWDFRLDGRFTGPTFVQFFYGLGNEYINFEEVFPDNPNSGRRNFHIIRGVHLDINPNLIRNLSNGKSLSLNPSFEYINFNNELNDPLELRFIFTPEAGVPEDAFDQKLYSGLGLEYTSNRVNNPALPTRGYIFNARADYRQSLSDTKFSNITISSQLAAYIPFSPSHKIVLATNIGGAYTIGDYEFFHANSLANQSRLRGYRTNRFAGDGMVYHASDLRIKLLQGNGGLKTGLGIFGSFDYGRVFIEDENIDDWHTSYGAGIYLTPLNLLGFKLGYYIGQEDTQLTVGGALAF
jgi:hypothetical protein